MPNTDQAQADPTDQPTVSDPLDMENTPNTGASELADYADEVSRMLEDDSIDMTDELTEHQEAYEDELTEEDEPSDEDGEEANEEENDAPEPPASNRFRFKDPADQAVAAIAKAKGISLVEAARVFAGDHPQATKADAVDETEAQETVASVNSRIEELKALRKEASAEMEFERRDEIQDEIEDLLEKRNELRQAETQAKARKDSADQQAFEEEFEKSVEKTKRLYPDSEKADSAFTLKMIEIDQSMKDLGDPNYHNPNKPFLLAKAAAIELGVLMKKPSTAPAKAAPRSSKSPIQPAAGNRGTFPAPGATQRFEAELDGLNSLEDYERRFGRA